MAAAVADRITGLARLGLGPPHPVVFRPDGAAFAVGTAAGLIRIFDAASNEETQRWAAGPAPILSLGYQPDRARLASGGADGAVVLWDPSDGRELGRFEGHDGAVEGLAFSPDGAILATASHDWTIGIWDLATGARLQTLRGHGFRVNGVVFSPDGTFLASAGDDTNVTLWDVASGRRVQTLKHGQDGFVRAVAFDPTGALLASAGQGTGPHIWEATTGEHLRQLDSGEVDVVFALSFSPDGRLLASAALDLVRQGPRNVQTAFGPLSVDDPHTGEAVARLAGHSEIVTSIAWSPDGATLASAAQDAAVRLWETEGWTLRTELTAGFSRRVNSLAFHGARDLLTVSRDTVGSLKDVTLWDVTTGQPRARTTTPNGTETFDVHPGRGLAAVGRIKGGVTIHQWPTGELVRPVAAGPSTSSQLAVFSPDASQLAISGSTAGLHGVILSDPGSSDRAQHLVAHRDQVDALAFSPDGTLLAVGGAEPFVTVWRTAPIELRATLELGAPVTNLAFSHDGSQLAIAKATGEIEVWEVAAGQPTWKVLGSASGVTSLQFHPAAPLLVSGDRDGLVALWAIGTDDPIQSLARHAVPVNAVAFNPEGDLLASGGDDGAIWLWGIPGGAAPG